MGCRTLLRVVGCALITWASNPTDALACAPCACDVPFGIRPAGEMQDHPRNTRFLIDLDVAQSDSSTRRLTTEHIRWINASSKQEVAFDALPAGEDPSLVWVVSKELLEADAEYRVTVEDGETVLFTRTFRTSQLVDDSPPEAEVPRVEQGLASRACGESESVGLVWDEMRDNGETMAYEPVVLARITDGSQTAELLLDAKNLVPRRGLPLAVPVDAASAKCWGKFGLPFDANAPLTVQLTVYDRAGNAQDLPPMDVNLTRDLGATCPSEEQGCNVAPGSTAAHLDRADWMLAIAACGLVWSRGRRLRR